MDQDTLVLTHVVFRHGNRTPELAYPNDPHKDATFFPTGRGHLTRKGKQSAYALGLNLRRRYNEFLGATYTPQIVDAWTSDSDRTKMSVQLVLASLFPPSEEERVEITLNWQPIPYHYVEALHDDMLLPILRPATVEAYDEHHRSAESAAALEKHQETFTDLTKHTGLTVDSIRGAFLLYGILKVEEEAGLTLPSWTARYWPKHLEKLAIEEFQVLTATAKLRKLTLGKLMTKIIDDSQKKIEGKSAYKIHLYSCHDLNVGLLSTFLQIPLTCIPKYCSFVAVEVHEIDGVYGVKVYRQDDFGLEPTPAKFENGQDFLSFDDFKKFCVDVYVKT